MSNRYSTAQAAIVDQDNPLSKRADCPISDEINALWKAAIRQVTAQLGASISATTSFLLHAPGIAAHLVRAALVVGTTVATDDTDYWTIGVVNLGPAGNGTTSMVGGSTANTTKATGGSALTAGIARDLTLATTNDDLATAAKDVLKVTLTKSGSAAALAIASITLDFKFPVGQ